MSFKYQVQKISDNHYVLPKMAQMNADVHAFLSEDLYNATEDAVWTQAANGASYPGVTAVYLQPDTHSGFGVPIGCVIVTDDVLIQACTGYDVNCGVCIIKTDLNAQDIAAWDKREDWIKEVEKRVALGVGSGRPKHMPEFHVNKLEEMFRYGAKAVGVHSDNCERQYIKLSDDFDSQKIEKAIDKANPQLGSLGSGNHFCEMQCDEKNGSVWVMIHCGSRGYGYQTMNHFFYAGAELRGLEPNQREKSWLRIDEPLGKEYWNYQNSAANYAIANRHIIVQGVQEALHKVYKAKSELYYEISHNLVQEETIVLPDGTHKKGFVHRKGATRAFPAGHPDIIGTKWEATGHPVVVPGSMYNGAGILFPKVGAYGSGCSVNHGSGRKLGRAEAKRKLGDKQVFIDDQMHNVKRKFGGTIVKGIVGNLPKTPIEEAGAVYKDLDAVLDVLVAENIAVVDRRLFPVANIKGND